MGKVELGAPAVSSWVVPTLPAWLAEAEKARKWLYPGLLLEEAIVCMSGQKKRAKKSMTAFAMGIGLAAGKPVGIWKPDGVASVLIAEEEGPRASTRERLLAICNGMGVDPASLNNVHFAFHQGVKLDQKKWRERLCKKVEEVKARLLILDAIVYMHDGDENKVADMAPVRETMHAVRSLGCTTMFLAHTDKARGEDPKADIDSQVRGSGLTTDAYDQHLALRRYNADDPITALTIRGRDQEERKYSVKWSFESVKDITTRAAMVVEDPKASFQNLILECANKLAMEHKYSLRLLQDLWQVPKSRAQLILDHLEELRLIEKRDSAWWKTASISSRDAGTSGSTLPDASVKSVSQVEEV